MRNKRSDWAKVEASSGKILIIAILIAIFSLIANPILVKSFAESTLVEGGVENLVPMTYTHYLDGYPAIFISGQQGEKGFQLLNRVDNILLTEGLEGLVLDFIQDRYKIDISDKEVGQFKVSHRGRYEIWIKRTTPEIIFTPLTVIIDGKPLKILATKRGRWSKLIEQELRGGTHEIKIDWQGEKPEKIVVIPQEEWEEYRSKMKEALDRPDLNFGYLLDFKSPDKTKEAPQYALSKAKAFYLPQESNYNFRVKLSPLLVKARDPLLKFTFNNLPRLKKEWQITPHNTLYNLIEEKEGIIFQVFFDGNEKEDEYVRLSREFGVESLEPKDTATDAGLKENDSKLRTKGLGINLERYPHFEMNYKVEDPQVQTIEVVAGIDFTGDGKVDADLKGLYPKPACREFDNFELNLYELAKKKYPDKKYYNLVKLGLYPHKLWGVDRSKERKGKYRFWIKELQIYGYSEKEFFKVKEKLSTVGNGLNIDFSSFQELRKWSLVKKEQDYALRQERGTLIIKKSFSFWKLSRDTSSIDLEQFPFLEINYKKPEEGAVEVFLSIDFNDDGKMDEEVFVSELPATLFQEKKVILNAYQLVKKYYPEEMIYKLVKISFRLEDIIPFSFKKIRIYGERLEEREKLIPPKDFTFEGGVFELDGKRYGFKKKFSSKKEAEEVEFSIKQVHLKEGEHNLKILPNENFRVDLIELNSLSKSALSPNPKKVETNIIFKKINPTRYQVEVKTESPFWLIFSESYHPQWRVYVEKKGKRQEARGKMWKTENGEGKIIEDYPKIGVREAGHLQKFTPSDIKYLFRQTDIKEHYLVNGYANAWYIEPGKLGLNKEFTVNLYFWPQSLFCLGLMISGATFISCIVYLCYSGLRKKKVTRNS